MNFRNKALQVKVNAQVVAERAVKPASRFIENQRVAHRAAVDEKMKGAAIRRGFEEALNEEEDSHLQFLSNQMNVLREKLGNIG